MNTQTATGIKRYLPGSAFLLALLFVVTKVMPPALGQEEKGTSALQRTPAPHDGQHDFDFHIGTWKTQVWRVQHPLTGSTTWAKYEGTTVVRKIWNGRANLVELEVDGPSHLELRHLRFYNPQTHEWRDYFANGTLGQPMIGEFKNGRGEFFAQEKLNDRAVLVRSAWSDITPNSAHFEQSFSDDGGKTWEVNWIMDQTRAKDESARTSLQRTPVPHDGQHDFDFHIGTWKTHLWRLPHPLTGSTSWVEYEGISVVRNVWNGRASLFELEVHGPAGYIAGVGLRLYNPQSHQWSLNWASGSDGTMTQPMIGEFKNGRGEFFDQESFNGRTILARNSFSDITPNSSRFEQAFSNNGGKTWETNWIMTFARVKDEADQAH